MYIRKRCERCKGVTTITKAPKNYAAVTYFTLFLTGILLYLALLLSH